MARTGFFSGSFDPMTNGHLDVIEHAAALCDRLVVGVGSNPNKDALFTVAERLDLIREAAAPIVKKAGCALEVISFTGLAVEAARRAGATLIVRGLRNSTDFNYEMQMAGMNGAMAGTAHGVLALLFAGQADHRHAGPPDRLDGRRRLVLRPAECGGGAEGEVRCEREACRLGAGGSGACASLRKLNPPAKFRRGMMAHNPAADGRRPCAERAR